MRKLNAFIWFFALCISLPLAGQNKSLAKANKFYKDKDYHAAIPLFEEGLLEDNNLVAKTKLANSYKSINQLDKAEKLYSTIVYDDKVKVESFKSYGETLMGNGKYAAAKFWFEEYLKKKPGNASVMQNLASCNKVYNIKPQFYNVVVESFPFNSVFDDNGAVMLEDKIVFSSDRPSGLKLLKQKVSDDGREFINIYSSSKSEGNWTEPDNFGNKFNLLNKNVGPITFNAAGDFAVFSRNADEANKSNEYSMQLYAAHYDGKKWKDIAPLNFCKPGYNYMHPALSPDGKMLFFASDKGGGEGKTDLYVSYRKAAAWSLPQNLGPQINTNESEGFPFVSADGKLYFCSKGLLGFGGFDIYSTEKDETTGNWNNPINLGFPMNSSSDDVSFYINEKMDAGLMASSRNNQGDDIFTFYIQEEEEEKEEVVAFVPKPKAEPKKEPVDEQMDMAKIEEEIKSIGSDEPELIPESEEVVEVETITQPSAPQVIEVSKAIEPEVKVETPQPPKKKKEAYTINKKSDEAITREVKSDTMYLDKSQLAANNQPIKTEAPIDIETTTVATNEAVLTSEKSKPVELVEVSTSGSMGNANTEIVRTEVKEEFPEPKVEQPTEAETIVKDEISDPVKDKVETVTDSPVQTEVVDKVEEKNQPVEEVVKDVAEAKLDKKKKKKNRKDKNKAKEEEADKIAETTEVPSVSKEEPKPEKEVFSANTPPAVADLSIDLQNGVTDNKYELADLKYAFNATDITPALSPALDGIASLLENNPNVNLQLIGHTGSIGSDEKNQRLSVARAAAAVDYLIGKGVSPTRLSFDGKGESELLNGCTDGILCGKAQHQENERIEIKVK